MSMITVTADGSNLVHQEIALLFEMVATVTVRNTQAVAVTIQVGKSKACTKAIKSIMPVWTMKIELNSPWSMT